MTGLETRACTRCSNEFTRPVKPYKQTSLCRTCKNKSNGEYVRRNREAYNAHQRAYAKRAGGYRTLNLKQYGITEDDYEQMLVAQSGLCAICQEPCASRSRLAVDHCHTTGKVRGLLCNNCNLALGQFKDDPARLDAAAEYLRRGCG